MIRNSKQLKDKINNLTNGDSKKTLMFEERKIFLMTYNIETLMAEKLETIIARGTANTRMRDFYDICILKNAKKYSSKILAEAIIKTAEKRGTLKNLSEYNNILFEVQNSDIMRKSWNNFRQQSFFVGETTWENVIDSCIELTNEIMDK